MKLAGTRLGGHQYLSAAEVSILRVEVAGNPPEVLDGVEIRHNRCAVVEILFYNAPIHRETVGRLALSADRKLPAFRSPEGGVVVHPDITTALGCLNWQEPRQVEAPAGR